MNSSLMPIPKGYLLSVTTWENDADNYKTEYFKGLTLVEAKGYLEIFNLFGADSGGFGNFRIEYERYGDANKEAYTSLCEKVYAIAAEYGLISNYTPAETLEERADISTDLMYELIGSWCDGEMLRVVEEVEVFFFPEEVAPDSIPPEELLTKGH